MVWGFGVGLFRHTKGWLLKPDARSVLNVMSVLNPFPISFLELSLFKASFYFAFYFFFREKSNIKPLVKRGRVADLAAMSNRSRTAVKGRDVDARPLPRAMCITFAVSMSSW